MMNMLCLCGDPAIVNTLAGPLCARGFSIGATTSRGPLHHRPALLDAARSQFLGVLVGRLSAKIHLPTVLQFVLTTICEGFHMDQAKNSRETRSPMLIQVEFQDGHVEYLPATTRCTASLRLPAGSAPLIREERERVVLQQKLSMRSEEISLRVFPIEHQRGSAVTVETAEKNDQGQVLWRPARIESWADCAIRLQAELDGLRGGYGPMDAHVAAAVFEELKHMTPAEFMASLVAAGICTPDGKLTPHYEDDSGQR